MARTTILIAAFTVLAWYLWPLPCSARPRYFDAFKRKYAPNPGNDFGRLVDTSKCFVCHPNKETKKERNHYGEALEKFLGKNEKNKANIDKALRDTEKLR